MSSLRRDVRIKTVGSRQIAAERVAVNKTNSCGGLLSYRTCAETAAVSRGTSYVTTSAVSTPLWWIFSVRCVKLQFHFESHRTRSGSARKQRIAIYALTSVKRLGLISR